MLGVGCFSRCIRTALRARPPVVHCIRALPHRKKVSVASFAAFGFHRGLSPIIILNEVVVTAVDARTLRFGVRIERRLRFETLHVTMRGPLQGKDHRDAKNGGHEHGEDDPPVRTDAQVEGLPAP